MTNTPQHETFTAGFEIKAINEDEGIFEGYASIFSHVDQGRDAVVPGAFSRSLNERGTKGVKLLWQHDPTEILGQILEIFEDAHGLFVKARLDMNVQRSREALSLLQAGALDGLSIGYKTITSRADDHNGIRHLIDVDLWEVSLVTFPMQPGARVTSLKAASIATIRDYENFLRDAGGYSRTEAKALAAAGFKGLSVSPRDAAVDWSQILCSINQVEQILKS